MFMQRRWGTAISFLAVCLALARSFGQVTPSSPDNATHSLSILWPPPTQIKTQALAGTSGGSPLFISGNTTLQMSIQPSRQNKMTKQTIIIQLAEMKINADKLEKTKMQSITDRVRLSQTQVTLEDGKSQNFTITTNLNRGDHYYVLMLSDSRNSSIRDIRTIHVVP